MKYLRTAKIKNKTVLVRGSVDAPVDQATGLVADDFRLRSFLPTLELLLSGGNKVIVCGKRGRPGGKVKQSLSLKPVAERLAELLDRKFVVSADKLPESPEPCLVFYTGNFQEDKHKKQLSKIAAQHLVVLENLEFFAKELENDLMFGKKLAGLAEAYVNDDFSKCHHLVASIGSVIKYLPGYAGLLLEKEIKSLDAVLKSSKKPFVLMMGGIKISDKVKTIENLGSKADKILLAGGLANLFFMSRGYEVGKSKVEPKGEKIAWLLEKNFKGKLFLPQDVVVANQDMDRDSIRVTEPHEVKSNEVIYDVGPKTILAFAKELKNAKTIIWNGPLGYFEKKPFHTATIALARLVGGLASRKAYVLVGGGETVDAVKMAHQTEHIDHLSTGGGAMLEYLAGKKLPGIEALK
ncbi:MAG: phosphoglycerate kinase [Patescibacteria group bacterium]|nr:phosphoglycerate kinase [Patescibacteria group bacterium]